MQGVQEEMLARAENPEADLCVFPPKPPPCVEVPEDIGGEFTAPLALARAREGPRVINVGIPGECFRLCMRVSPTSHLFVWFGFSSRHAYYSAAHVAVREQRPCIRFSTVHGCILLHPTLQGSVSRVLR